MKSWKIRWTVISLILVTGLWAIKTLRFQTELLPLFPTGLPSVKQLEEAQENLESDNVLWIVFDTSEDQVPWGEKILSLIDSLQKLPSVQSVEKSPQGPLPISTQLALATILLSTNPFQDLVNALQPSHRSERLAKTLEQFAGGLEESELARLRFDPLRLIDFFPKTYSFPSNRPLLLKIIAKKNLKNFGAAQQFRNEIKQIAQQIEPDFSSHAFLTGRPAFVAEISQAMQRDMIVMLIFTLALVSLAFLGFYRSLKPLGWILLLQTLSLLCGFIAGRFIFGELNVLSLGFASILLGVGMDYCILVYHHFATGHSLNSPSWKMLRHGIWLSALTTAGAFGVLYVSHFPGLQQLAVLVAIGLIATAGFATEFLSVWLEKKKLNAPHWILQGSEKSAQFLQHHTQTIRWGFYLFLICCAFVFVKFRHYPFYQNDLSQLQSTHLEAYRGQQLLSSQLPALSSQIHSFVEALEKNRGNWVPISETSFFATFEKNGLDRSWGKLTWEVIEKLNAWHAGNSQLTSLIRSANAWPQLQRDLNHVAVEDFKRLSFAMLAILVTLCAIAHRKIKLVFLNLFALITALGLLAVFLFLGQISMTLVSLLTIPLLIGLTIDYSLHILLALEQYHGSFKMTYLHLAAPVTLTGLSSLIGFSAPLLSSQPVLQNFGMVMDLGILAAVITGLILLPVFYERLYHKQSS
ncbi:MAG: MMPL family transporter [Verrucomicrobiae bacterium]|nr:MMPL family transporter [Verrucomicrobiae bacterium]